jgi:hypothetical protein
MAMKEQQKTVHRSMQGKEVDMNKLINQNEMTVAVGNAKVNARGDELGPGGIIVKKREDVIREATQGVPDQANVRSSTKDVSGMDPEGNE